MSTVIDLSLPIITGHWRYSNQMRAYQSIAKGDAANVSIFEMKTHMFTHIDAPKHMFDDGKTLDCFPLDSLVGTAAVLDLSGIAPNTPIGKELLAQAYAKCEPSTILLVKTAWDLQRDWKTVEYWDDAPYITDEGAAYLQSLHPRVVGYDFPQDHDIRLLRTKDEHECDLTTHHHILKHDIMMIEYMTNLGEISGTNVEFIGLPLKLAKTDGAPIRCIAIQ